MGDAKKAAQAEEKKRKKSSAKRKKSGDPRLCSCRSLHRSHVLEAAAAGADGWKEVFAYYHCSVKCGDCSSSIKKALKKSAE